MGIIFFAFCLTLYFFVEDAGLRARKLVNSRKARAFLNVHSHRIARQLFAMARILCDVRIEKEGGRAPEPPPQFLLISNHQSLIDILVLIYCFPRSSLRFVGKKELFRFIPLVSLILRIQRHARIDRRGNFSETLRELANLGDRASRDGSCPTVFPEGTRARTPRVGPFHHGAIRAILRAAPLPIVTAALNGGGQVAGIRKIGANLPHLRYRFRILSVYPAPGSKSDIDNILDEAHAEISGQVAIWQEEKTES